jgi:hypothetical protein
MAIPTAFTFELYPKQICADVSPVASSFWPIIKKCLDPDPSCRYANYDDLREATKAVLRQAGVAPMDFVVNSSERSFASLLRASYELEAAERPSRARAK